MNDNYNELGKRKYYQDSGISKNFQIHTNAYQLSNNNNNKNSTKIKSKNNTKNNYIKIDLNKYNKNTKKEYNNIPHTKKVETITIDINQLQNSNQKSNCVNRNLNIIPNKKNKNNNKSKILYKKLKLYKDEETGNLSTGLENKHTMNNTTDIKSFNSKEEKLLKRDLNYVNKKRNTIEKNDYTSSKSFDISDKNKSNYDYNIKYSNNYGVINKTSNMIFTDPTDELKKNYYKNINMDKINKINKIEHIYNNYSVKVINKKEYNKEDNNKINNKKDNLYKEENNKNENEYIPTKITNNNKHEINIKESDVFTIEKNSELFSSQKNNDNNIDNNQLSNSNDSIVEEKFAYDKNSFKNKNSDINLDSEYLNKYLKNDKENNNNNDINNNLSNKENSLKNNNDEKYNFGKIEENIDFRVSLIKPNINIVEYKNEDNSKNFSLGSSKAENNINLKSKEEIISNKSNSTNLKHNNINSNTNTYKNQNYNVMEQKGKINNNMNNIDMTLKNKDSINDNQLEESSYYNMNFYDSRVTNINGINSNMNSNNGSNKNIFINTRNTKLEIPLDNSSMNNSNNYNGYNNYYNSFIISNVDPNESKNLKNEKEFINLKPNKAFKKFLTSKIKYYMNEDSIPKKFISEFISEKHRKKNRKIKNVDNDLDLNNIDDNFQHKNKTNIFEDDYSDYFDTKTINPIYRGRSARKENYNEYNNKYNKNNKLLKEKYKIKKSLLLNQNKELLNKINKLQQFINDSKNQMEERDNKIKIYLSTYDKISSENKENKKKIENLQYELNAKYNEVEEKKKKIYELNNINNNLENRMIILKKEYVNETINNKETKENYVMIKNSYNDIKNQYDLLNIKYQTLSDENYNFRRDKLLYEKELKTKNLMIEDLLQSNSNIKQKELKERIDKFQLNQIEEKENEKYFISKEKQNLKDELKNNNNNNKNIIEEEKKEKEEIVINKAVEEDVRKFDEYGMDDLINKREELMRDRKNATNEYYKIPHKANSAQIKKRNELEVKLDQINNDLAKIRIRINILKNPKKY